MCATSAGDEPGAQCTTSSVALPESVRLKSYFFKHLLLGGRVGVTSALEPRKLNLRQTQQH